MAKISIGILPIRKINDQLYFLIGHPGGPYWENKDEGAWSIIKGAAKEENSEEKQLPFLTGLREFKEETGISLQSGSFFYIGEVKQKSGKIVKVWATPSCKWEEEEGFISNFIEIDYKGNKITIPEIDKLEWCIQSLAKYRLNKAQHEFIDKLQKRFNDGELKL